MRVERICGHSFLPALVRRTGVVLDCGANRGEFSRSLLAVMPEVCIYAFEPDPALFVSLPDLARVHKLNMAVSGDGRDLDLYIGETKCSTAFYREHEGQQCLVVSSVTIPEFCRAQGISHVDLLKLDIEGAEFEVLRGLPAALLEHIGQITVEFHDFLDKDSEELARTCEVRLTEQGFRRIRFSWHDHSDVLFVNRDLHPINTIQDMGLRLVKYGRGIGRLIRRTFHRSG